MPNFYRPLKTKAEYKKTCHNLLKKVAGDTCGDIEEPKTSRNKNDCLSWEEECHIKSVPRVQKIKMSAQSAARALLEKNKKTSKIFTAAGNAGEKKAPISCPQKLLTFGQLRKAVNPGAYECTYSKQMELLKSEKKDSDVIKQLVVNAREFGQYRVFANKLTSVVGAQQKGHIIGNTIILSKKIQVQTIETLRSIKA